MIRGRASHGANEQVGTTERQHAGRRAAPAHVKWVRFCAASHCDFSVRVVRSSLRSCSVPCCINYQSYNNPPPNAAIPSALYIWTRYEYGASTITQLYDTEDIFHHARYLSMARICRLQLGPPVICTAYHLCARAVCPAHLPCSGINPLIPTERLGRALRRCASLDRARRLAVAGDRWTTTPPRTP